MSEEDKEFEKFRKCFLNPRIGLFPALHISTREINKLSSDEIMDLAREGLSTFGYAGIGMRSAVYAVYKPENLEKIMKKLEEKGVKYRRTTTLAPICEE